MRIDNLVFLVGSLMLLPLPVMLIVVIFGGAVSFNQIAAGVFLALFGGMIMSAVVAVWSDQ